MLDKRDELIANIAKSLGLVNDAGLSRAIDLKKRFPQQKLEQILESAGLINKDAKAKLASAFNQRVRDMQAKGTARAAPARPAPAPTPRPIEESGALLNSLHQSEPPAVDPLATPPSEEELSADSDVAIEDEEKLLAEPTIMLPDAELKKGPKPSAPIKKPAPLTEDQILAEPTLLVPDEDQPLISPASNVPSEEQILAEPTIVVNDAKLELAPGSEAIPEAELAIPDEIGLGSGPPTKDSGPVPAIPGAKKRTGKLDRREFERRSKLRMGFEGMTVGDYEIAGELSRGAFGVVLKVKPGTLARQLAKERGFLSDELAMKVMLSASDPEETRRFTDEIQVLINLNHPNIVRMFDAGGESGLQYYAMEMIQGVDSRTLVRESGGKLPVLYAARIARDVASALESVHQKTIFHRDLKPANVMIDRASNPYRTVLIDFGLVAKRTVSKGDEGLILGTPSYMPPEQAKPKGGFGEVNATSDLYSLGATFYFLMTGTAPFPGKDPREIIKRVCSEPPPDPTTLNPEIPKTIAAIAMKCLAKQQRERYHSAALLIKDLDKELSTGHLKLKAKGFMRKIFGGGSGRSPQQGAPPPG